jgi:RNA polymerase sigma-70 factor (sigma-E family)
MMDAVAAAEAADDDFRAFVGARWRRMLRTAYLLTGSPHDAEDLVQTALARTYSRWGRVQRADDPDAYVWRVMINLNVDRLRRRSVREWLTDRLPERLAGDRSDQVATRSALLDALGRLPARQRAVVVLRYAEDRSETEVAAMLGIGVGTVRGYSSRGLARLRDDGALQDLRSEREGASGDRSR